MSSAKRSSSLSRAARSKSICSDEGLNLEDVLVARYLDELHKPSAKSIPATELPQSPYQQKLANSHVVPLQGCTRRRPMSAASGRHARPGVNETYDDLSYGDDRPPRPTSAPVHRRPHSAHSSYSRPGSAKSVAYTKKVRSLYRQQLNALVVYAFRNGSRLDRAHVAAPNLSMLLEACTDKLQLPKAARKIFSADGTELLREKDITRDMEVYVSTGEPFRDPLKDMQQTVNISLKSQWTMNGLVWPKDSNKKPYRTRMSRHFRGLIQSAHRRVLVFQNGSGTSSIEVVADPKKMEEFLTACTAKLELGCCGRMLFDWEGNEVFDLANAPVLDECLQNGSTPVLGPLWLSKGEGFSPKGVKQFLSGLIAYTKCKLKEAKQYQKQLQYSQEEDTREKVEIVAILSMSEKEVDDALKIVAHDIDVFSNACNRLQEQLDKIKEAADEEQENGVSYTMKHIKTMKSDDKMIGKRGVRLKVYENGSNEHATVIFFNMQQAMRGIETIDAKLKNRTLMQRLLDQCANCSSLAYPKKTPAIRPVPRKLFDKIGKEIKSVYELQYDQEIWLSFGEQWINPSTYVIAVQLDKVRAFEVDDSSDGLGNHRTRALREQLMNEDTSRHFDSLRGPNWEVVTGIPDDFSKSTIRSAMEKDTIFSQLASAEIDAVNSSYLRNKEGRGLLLFCEAVVGDKLQKAKTEKKEADSNEATLSSKTSEEKRKKIESTFNDLQLWNISKNGYISNKSAPQLVLGVFHNQRVVTCLGHPVQGQSETKVDGFYVGLQKKESGSASQQWTFTAEGNICSQERSDLLLTYVGSVCNNEESHVTNEEPGLASGQRVYLCACARVDGKQAASQRWALKQERFDNIGQWKHTRVDNPEWNKRALSWPVNQDGELNEKYDWPMEGYLLPYAPPTKLPGSMLGTNDSLNNGCGSDHGIGNSGPLRMKVMKNGMSDQTEAVVVVAPSLKKSSVRDTSSVNSTSNSRQRRRQTRRNKEDQSVEGDTKMHCIDLTVLKQQFVAFLDQCTTLLDLPFAGRRLFDENGVEYFNLSTLRRDQVVYVTCGEPWSDPKLSKSEQQRHFLLANLASDVSQIRHYIQLSQALNLVLEVDPAVGLRAGAQLIINESALPNDDNETPQENDDVSNSLLNTMSAHEMSHKKTDEQDSNKLRWPWEKLVNSGAEASVDLASEETQENRAKKFKSTQSSHSLDRLSLQQFLYDDGYIACNGNRELVLSVHEQDGGHAPAVCLAKRRVEDICQRWIVTDHGLIQAKCNPQMVLTVSMKRFDGATQTYVGCSVALQRTKKVQLGRANQRWLYDSGTGLIRAFFTDTVDKEVTASNVANVCTYAVMGDTEIDQACYEVELPAEKGEESKKIWTCSSCARAMRGRYRITKLENSVDFVCTMGKAKELGIQQVGSFRCLNGKVDLSTHEAEHTLHTWETRLQKLRQEVGARTIAKNISAANAPYTVKVLAYRNGDGRLKQPEQIIGSSIPGILSQCSKRLKMTQAARRLYTSDGTMVLSVDDLLEWAKDSYVKAEKKRLQREANGNKNSAKEKQAGDGPNSDAEDQDDNEDGNTVALPQGTEFVVGNDSSCDRAYLDDTQNCIIIPDIPPIQADGLLVSWIVYARQPGTVALNVFRRGDEELNLFNIVGQTVFTVKDGGLGELIIDISSQPIKVQRGDVIGLHVVDQSVIPYDQDESRMSTMFFQSLENIEAHGMTVKLESDLFPTRTYSLMANVVVAADTKKKENDTKTHTTKDTSDPKAMARIKVDPPPIEAMLRYPIEVFVSCGEAFVKPQKAIEDSNSRRQQRNQVAAVSYELYKEKHVLRLMKGRRIEEQTPTRLNVTSDPGQPVLVEGGWQQPSVGETEKHSLIRHLQMEMHKIRSAHKPKTVRITNTQTTRRLYTQPDTKRLLIFPNGEAIESAQYVWGDTVSQILYNSVMRLGLHKQPKYLFTLDGRVVNRLQFVERDQILCVSSNKKFLRPKESQRFVEIKANWVRACKRRGHQASDLDKILFAGSGGSDDVENEVILRKHEGHTHSIEWKANKFSACPTCQNKCVDEMEVDDSVQLSARRS